MLLYRWKYRTENCLGWKLERKLARLFLRLARWIWKHELMACDHCGRLVGMNNSITKYGHLCEPCLKRAKTAEADDDFIRALVELNAR